MTTTRHTLSATITPAAPIFVRGVTVFYDDFHSGVSSWLDHSASSTHTAVAVGQDRTEMQVAYAGSGTNPQVYRVITTVVGRKYRAVAHGYSATTQSITLTPVGSLLTPARASASSYGYPVELYQTFEATSTSTSIFLRAATGTPAAGTSVRFVDVEVYELGTTDVIDLAPTTAQVSLDESWTPYVQGSLTCPLPTLDVLEAFDPRRSPRALITMSSVDTESLLASDFLVTLGNPTTAAGLTSALSGKTAAYLSLLLGAEYNATVDPLRNGIRTADVAIRSRTVDYIAGTMTLTVTSDESALQDFARWDDSTGDQVPTVTNSLASLVNWGLGLLGWELGDYVDAQIDPATVDWNLGDSMWSFLDSFVRTNDLRLWCDESRVWHLTPPQTGDAGVLILDSLTGLTDTLTRDEGYADSAAVIYEWIDGAGATQRVYQFAGALDMSAPKTTVLKFNSQNPNLATAPASQLRTRSLTRGRAVAATGVSVYSATPGQALTLAMPVAAPTGAMVSAVTWQFPDDVMTIKTRDAIA